jgi:hypothetical protein
MQKPLPLFGEAFYLVLEKFRYEHPFFKGILTLEWKLIK